MTDLPWVTCHGHEPGCPCFACCMLNDILMQEAIASVALDRDDRAQTISLDEWEARDDGR